MDNEIGLGENVSPRYDVPDGAVASVEKVVVAAPAGRVSVAARAALREILLSKWPMVFLLF
jgi:hypothetical protein